MVLNNCLPTLLQREAAGAVPIALLERIALLVSPWMVCATSHVRVTGLCIYQQIITRLSEAWGEDGKTAAATAAGETGKTGEGGGVDSVWAKDVMEQVRFSRENKDLVRMSRKHLSDFRKFDVIKCSTLDAILATPVNEYHEFFPPDSVQEVRTHGGDGGGGRDDGGGRAAAAPTRVVVVVVVVVEVEREEEE